MCSIGFGLKLDNSTCLNNINNCKIYISKTTCSECIVSYNLDIFKTHCYNTIKYCSIYSAENYCNKCQNN